MSDTISKYLLDFIYIFIQKYFPTFFIDVSNHGVHIALYGNSLIVGEGPKTLPSDSNLRNKIDGGNSKECHRVRKDGGSGLKLSRHDCTGDNKDMTVICSE